jgi:AraC family transcriptional regulator
MDAASIAGGGAARPRKGGLAPHCLRRVVAHIRDHLDGDLSLRALAGIARLSEGRFAHNFKAATGVAPHRFVIQERVARARRLLDETEMTITDVAHAIGFGSASRFALWFRRAEGVTPSTYRLRLRVESATSEGSDKKRAGAAGNG